MFWATGGDIDVCSFTDRREVALASVASSSRQSFEDRGDVTVLSAVGALRAYSGREIDVSSFFLYSPCGRWKGSCRLKASQGMKLEARCVT